MQNGSAQPRDKKEKGSENEPVSPQRSGLSESERIRELRDRLYSRGDVIPREVRHALPHRPEPTSPNTPTHPHPPAAETVPVGGVQYTPMAVGKRRSSMRKWLLGLGILFFMGALGVSSFFMFSGSNTISGENISFISNTPSSSPLRT